MDLIYYCLFSVSVEVLRRLLCVCANVCRCMCTGTDAHVCLYGLRPGVNLSCHSSGSTLLFESVSLTSLGLNQFLSSRLLGVSVSSVLGLHIHANTLNLFCFDFTWVTGIELDSHTCKTNTLLTGLFPQPLV